MGELMIMALVYGTLVAVVVVFLLSIRRGSYPVATCMIDGRIERDLAEFKKRLVHIGDMSPGDALVKKRKE